MDYNITKEAENFLEGELDGIKALLKTISLIPAPSGFEDERAEFVKAWLENIGAEGVYIDEAKNVIYKLEGEKENNVVVYMAHTDTVFPSETPLLWREENGRLYCPGIGDDTCSLVVLLTVVKYIVKNGLKPKRTVIFVANSCEEGLGNLKGSKQIVQDFGDIISEFYTFDHNYTSVVTRCVGSHRYKITAKTEGGHSFGAFGNTNAIAELSRLVCELYTAKVPEKEGTKTTYNVGMISGGTSVNTIAQYAEMLYEYRSDDRECLGIMKRNFEEKIEEIRSSSKAKFSVELVGDRPSDGNFDKEKHRKMIERVQAVCSKFSGVGCPEISGSTDANSASSEGIPAVCLGVYLGGGAHTRDEWIAENSILPGLKIAAELILDNFNT